MGKFFIKKLRWVLRMEYELIFKISNNVCEIYRLLRIDGGIVEDVREDNYG